MQFCPVRVLHDLRRPRNWVPDTVRAGPGPRSCSTTTRAPRSFTDEQHLQPLHHGRPWGHLRQRPGPNSERGDPVGDFGPRWPPSRTSRVLDATPTDLKARQRSLAQEVRAISAMTAPRPGGRAQAIDTLLHTHLAALHLAQTLHPPLATGSAARAAPYGRLPPAACCGYGPAAAMARLPLWLVSGPSWRQVCDGAPS